MSLGAVAVDWDINGIGESRDFARFALLGALLQMYVQDRAVLDIGCDTGKLSELLGKAHYTGIDARIDAIERAREMFPSSRFICARAEDWISDCTFEAVIFNESLYYLKDFTSALEKFHGRLQFGGLLAVSIFKHGTWFSPNAKALKASRSFMDRHYQIIHDITITSGRASWCILIARKRS